MDEPATETTQSDLQKAEIIFADIMKLKKNERIVCPAIWIDDGEKYDNQPENIKTGYIVYGIHLVDIFFNMSSKETGHPINLKAMKTNEIHEGYYTNSNRFIIEWIDY
ncbi:MAG: hypothetical protein JXK95_01225 [Bacteroidales bacterium]|nr:hypothetical protein [Bacteroidales bacterium]